MKTILIAGGAGFIGSNLCKKLIQYNKIICLDNLLTGKMSNIQCLMNNTHFRFINHDIVYTINIDDDIDEIYNLACPASPLKYQMDPVQTLKINFIGTMNLLELAKEKKCKILQSSTSEIYGEPECSPQTEAYRGNVNTVGIRSCYDEGKRISETLMMDYHRKYNIDIRIVRIFNTYGPNMDIFDGRVIPNFIYQMINNLNITVYGDGTQTRSFCYIDDLMDGLVKLMDSNYHQPMNIGNSHEMTMNELIRIMKQQINTTSIIEFTPLPLDDPTNRKPNITLAKEILNWEPKIDLISGLRHTIEFIKTTANL
jgi:UDP-glucuronate decarboxylase